MIVSGLPSPVVSMAKESAWPSPVVSRAKLLDRGTAGGIGNGSQPWPATVRNRGERRRGGRPCDCPPGWWLLCNAPAVESDTPAACKEPDCMRPVLDGRLNILCAVLGPDCMRPVLDGRLNISRARVPGPLSRSGHSRKSIDSFRAACSASPSIPSSRRARSSVASSCRARSSVAEATTLACCGVSSGSSVELAAWDLPPIAGPPFPRFLRRYMQQHLQHALMRCLQHTMRPTRIAAQHTLPKLRAINETSTTFGSGSRGGAMGGGGAGRRMDWDMTGALIRSTSTPRMRAASVVSKELTISWTCRARCHVSTHTVEVTRVLPADMARSILAELTPTCLARCSMYSSASNVSMLPRTTVKNVTDVL